MGRSRDAHRLWVALVCAIIVSHRGPSLASRYEGSWSSSSAGKARGSPIKIIASFAFDKTDIHHLDQTNGYIFGNLTSDSDSDSKTYPWATLVLIERAAFTDVRTFVEQQRPSDEGFCSGLFELIDSSADCAANASSHHLRLVPCVKGSKCPEDERSTSTLPDKQFTIIVNNEQPT